MSKVKEFEYSPACDCSSVETQAGIVLDPFLGSGTTAQVANYLGLRYTGIDLNVECKPLIEEKILEGRPMKQKKAKPKINKNKFTHTSLFELFGD